MTQVWDLVDDPLLLNPRYATKRPSRCFSLEVIVGSEESTAVCNLIGTSVLLPNVLCRICKSAPAYANLQLHAQLYGKMQGESNYDSLQTTQRPRGAFCRQRVRQAQTSRVSGGEAQVRHTKWKAACGRAAAPRPSGTSMKPRQIVST